MLNNRKCSLRANNRPQARTNLKSLGRGVVDFGTQDGTVVLAVGDRVELIAGYAIGGTATRLYKSLATAVNYHFKPNLEDYSVASLWELQVVATEEDHGSADGSTAVAADETVLLAGGYANGGTAGRVYKFVGTPATIDLSLEDYSITADWELQYIATEEEHETDDGTQNVEPGQQVLLAAAYAGGGTAGSVYKRDIAAAAVTLATEDYSVTATWTLVGTGAATIALSTAIRDVHTAVPDPASVPLLTDKIVQTVNRAEGVAS